MAGSGAQECEKRRVIFLPLEAARADLGLDPIIAVPPSATAAPPMIILEINLRLLSCFEVLSIVILLFLSMGSR
jgi:hypothetical protein